MLCTPELREIRVFLTLAEELHYGRTAERLMLTPSRVSQIIRTLEAQIGGELFNRTSRRVTLTPLGERLAASLEPAHRQLVRALEDAREAATGIAGTLRIGTYLRLNCGPHWARIVQTFTRCHPGCEIEMIDTWARDSLESLRRGELDMLVMRLPLSDPDLAVGPVLSREGRVLLVAKTHPLADRETVGVEDLGDYLVPDRSDFPREMMDAFIPPVTPSGRRVPKMTVGSFEEVLMLVEAGRLVHPTVTSFLNYFNDDSIVVLSFRDLPPSETALVWLRRNHSPKVGAFARVASEVVEFHGLNAEQQSSRNGSKRREGKPPAIPARAESRPASLRARNRWTMGSRSAPSRLTPKDR